MVDSIFSNAGNYTFFQKQGTSAGDVEDRSTPSLWIKVLGSQEKIDVDAREDKGKFKTIYYGAVAGLDFDRQYSDNFDATYGFFVSYVGDELKRDADEDNKLNQNTGYVGLKCNWYIGKLFINGVVNYGFSANKADFHGYKKDFNSHTVGLAAKLGYNFEVANRSFTIQPNVAATGTYLIMEDLKEADDSKVDNAKNYTVEPGLKLAKTLGKCWILTGEGKYVIEKFENKTKCYGDSIYDISHGNYGNVGLGIEKIWGYTVLNVKANKTLGARDGYGVNAGIEFKF